MALHVKKSVLQKGTAGFFLFELLIVAVVTGAAATLLLGRLSYHQEVAEQALVEYAVRTMRSGLRLQVAQLMVKGRMQEAALLAGENPMNWLEPKPKNYLGEFVASHPRHHEPGNWYFNQTTRTLTYLVKHQPRFTKSRWNGTQIDIRVVAVQNAIGTAENKESAGFTDTVELQVLTP